ncbi:MAG: EAL domain-containing protein [Saccharofermentans sp.]|nr:EAL domain-containing protein [Saccharofermentans sp.]
MDPNVVLRRFIDKELAIKQFFCRADSEAIAEFAEEFKIAKVDFLEYLSEDAYKQGNANLNLVFYDSKKPSKNTGVEFRDPKALGGFCTFRVFPLEGTFWSPEESEFAYSVARMLILIKGKMKIFQSLTYLSYHDPISGEYSTAYARKLVEERIASNDTIGYVVMFMNVRGMSEVNRSYTFAKASNLMFKFMREVKSILEDDELLWRFGGDNFGCYLRREHLDAVLRKISSCEIEDENGDKVYMSAVAGIYIFNGDEPNHAVAFDGAQQSLSIARFIKHVPYLFYDDDIIRINAHSTMIEMTFDATIAEPTFVPFFQPKVSVADKKLIGAEALCRWFTNGEYVVPAEFIPVLERSRRICALDFVMLKRLCVEIKGWLDQGIEAVPISINFSRRHLNNIRLASDICSVIDSYSIPHELVIIEFTETTNEADQNRLRNIVMALKNKGIKTSVDDFGVGYSSMSMIRDIPFDELKIDRSFIVSSDDIDNEDRKIIMMKHVIGLANDLGMHCIAEGAETEKHLKMLEDNGCEMVQGFLFDKPLPSDEFVTRLKNPDYYLTR